MKSTHQQSTYKKPNFWALEYVIMYVYKPVGFHIIMQQSEKLTLYEKLLKNHIVKYGDVYCLGCLVQLDDLDFSENLFFVQCP